MTCGLYRPTMDNLYILTMEKFDCCKNRKCFSVNHAQFYLLLLSALIEALGATFLDRGTSSQ